jgi:hypothetical protein
MEKWKGLFGRFQKLIDTHAHQRQADFSVYHLHNQWNLFQEQLSSSRVPVAHIESMLTQARRTLTLVCNPEFQYIDNPQAKAFFNDELHDLNLCTIDDPIEQRREFSFLWLQKHWILCNMLGANNEALQNPIRSEHFNGSPLPYPDIPHDVKHIHGLLEIYQTGIIARRKTALEKAMSALKPPQDKKEKVTT